MFISAEEELDLKSKTFKTQIRHLFVPFSLYTKKDCIRNSYLASTFSIKLRTFIYISAFIWISDSSDCFFLVQNVQNSHGTYYEFIRVFGWRVEWLFFIPSRVSNLYGWGAEWLPSTPRLEPGFWPKELLSWGSDSRRLITVELELNEHELIWKRCYTIQWKQSETSAPIWPTDQPTNWLTNPPTDGHEVIGKLHFR